MTISLHLADPVATARCGAALAHAISAGMVIALQGDLGTGKTSLVRGVLRECGWSGPVKSPSYTLVEHYPFSSLYFYHFDFYRFNNSSEWETAGIAEYFRSDSVCLVEWPERVRDLLPLPDLHIVLTHPADSMPGRGVTLHANSAAGERCVDAILTAMRTERPSP